jgi:hypothetical protein
MELKRDYEAQGEKLVLYSCRHAYAHRAHVICDLPPKVVAAAMGHSVQTHLAAYSRCSELSGVMPHGLREPAQPLFLQCCQILLDCFGWVLEAGPVLPHRHADPLGIQVQLIHQKRIGMAGAKAVARQGVLWEIIQVEGEDQISSALDGGSQNMAVIRIWTLQGWNQGLMAIHQRISRSRSGAG